LAAEPKRVLLLHPSSGINLLAAINVRAELLRQSAEPLEIYDASVVTGRPANDIVSDRPRHAPARISVDKFRAGW